MMKIYYKTTLGRIIRAINVSRMEFFPITREIIQTALIENTVCENSAVSSVLIVTLWSIVFTVPNEFVKRFNRRFLTVPNRKILVCDKKKKKWRLPRLCHYENVRIE